MVDLFSGSRVVSVRCEMAWYGSTRRSKMLIAAGSRRHFFEAVHCVALSAVKVNQERNPARGLHGAQIACGDLLQGNAVNHDSRIPVKFADALP
jgi:hypothetical protein